MQRITEKVFASRAAVFVLFWGVLFLLYLPAAQCGWVSDTLGWLDAIKRQSFGEYINRSHFGVHSFYQTTQFVTWSLYQLVGSNHWAWHLIHITLHAFNCTLLFVLVKRLLRDSGIPAGAEIAFAVAALFCTSPYVTEVIVWEASFHYLQGLCFILGILCLLQRYLHHPRSITALLGFLLFAASAFSLELFYLTPLLTASVVLYYRVALAFDAGKIRKAAFGFLLPQAGMMLMHLLLVKIVLGATSARLGDALLKMPLTYYAVKPPQYFFHLVGGRFLPQSIRDSYHGLVCTYWGAGLFYLALVGTIIYAVARFKRMQRKAQVISLSFLWLLLAMALVTPMWFPERLLILGDRYLYIMLPFFFMVLVLLLGRLKSRALRLTLGMFAILLQCGLTLYLAGVWHESQKLTDKLQGQYESVPDKHVLLLNNPASLKGAPMIGAGEDGEFRLMHELLYERPIGGKVSDVLAASLTSVHDSTVVRVLSDSVIEVGLAAPGSFWWYGPDYAKSYQTPDYGVQLMDLSHYRLILHGDVQRFMLKFQQNGKWETVVREPVKTPDQQ